jgi:hypothetical protein
MMVVSGHEVSRAFAEEWRSGMERGYNQLVSDGAREAMIIIRCFIGFFKTLVNLWGWYEWFYYTKTGFDPKTPAHTRWEIGLRSEDKAPDTDAERVLPVQNHLVELRDRYMQTPDEVIFYSTDRDKVEVLMEQYNRELKTRSSGDFYYKMIKGRDLAYIHKYKIPGDEPLVEGGEVDPEQEREKFLR